jgi:two-component system sensor histidine kinase KdpD
VTLLERADDTSRRPTAQHDSRAWTIVANVGGEPCATPSEADVEVQVDDTLTMVLRGRTLAATDRRIVEAFAAQAAIALRQERLTAEAAAAKPLAEADKMRTALLAAVSHDLRTPLASAKAAVAGLRAQDVQFSDDDRDELLATADESLDKLDRLVANLLDMSRLQAGAIGVVPVDIGAEEIVPRALDDLGPPGRTVTLHLSDDLPALHADPGLLERILVNLIANALRYSPPGRPPAVTASAHGMIVEVRIIDHGPGIPADRWDDVFLPFQRLGDRDNHTGVGLGLALSRGLTQAMGGTLTPEETPGGGLTMILSLPAATSTAVDASERQPA